MILFIVDQVAGAEYVFPLLNKWRETGNTSWKIMASEVSASFLKKRCINCEEMNTPSTFEVKKAIDKIIPDKAVLSSTGCSQLEQLFLLELKREKITTFSFVDSWVNYSRRFHYGKGSLYPDMILTIDEKAKQEMISEGIPGNIITIVGQPYFEYCLAFDARRITPGRESVLLLTQPVSRFYEKRLGYDEKSFMQICLDVWGSLEKNWSKLSVLVHPAEDLETYREIVDAYSSDIPVVRGDDCRLSEYSLVVGMFSSMMVRSLLAGIPTVSLQPGACGEDLNFLSRNGYIQRFTEPGDFHRFLRSYSRDPGHNENSMNKFRSILKDSCSRFERCILNSQSGGMK